MEVSDSSRVIDVAWVSGRGSPLTVGLRNDAPVHCALPFRFFRFSSYHDLLIICVLFQPKKYFNAARFHRLSSPTTKSTSRLVVASPLNAMAKCAPWKWKQKRSSTSSQTPGSAHPPEAGAACSGAVCPCFYVYDCAFEFWSVREFEELNLRKREKDQQAKCQVYTPSHHPHKKKTTAHAES